MDELAVQELLAEQAIRRVLTQYCRGVDRADEELIRNCYHEDATDERGWFRGRGWEFASLIAEDHRDSRRPTLHLLANVTCEIRGRTAQVEAYTFALSTTPDEEGPVQAFAGRYLDRFECREGDWRIAHRVVVRDWHAALSRQAGVGFLRDLGDQLRGRPDPDDPSYRLFEEPPA